MEPAVRRKVFADLGLADDVAGAEGQRQDRVLQTMVDPLTQRPLKAVQRQKPVDAILVL